MSSSYTNLLGLVLPVQGELEGTWGDTVNQQLTQLLDDAVANAVTLNLTAGDVTLTSLSGAADQARMAILIVTGTPGVTRTVTAPSKSKVYQVINQSNSSVVIKGAATIGVTILAGASGVVAWNGGDFIELGAIASNRTVAGNFTVNGTALMAAGAASTPSLTTTGDANTGLYFPAADTVAIATGGVKRVEVDANGNVGVGITPSFGLHVNRNAVGAATYSIVASNNAGGGGTNLSGFGFSDGNSLKSSITAAVYGNDYMAFNVGGSGTTERARITSDGNLLLGTTTATDPNIKMEVVNSGITGCYLANNPTSAGTNHTLFAGKAIGVDRFWVLGNGNVANQNNSYGGISDAKLKENIVDTAPKLDSLLKVRIVNYSLKTNPQFKQIGVIAQELEQVFPSMIEEMPDRDDEGNDLGTVTKSVKYSVFVPILIKALQEQQALIDAQKTAIESLTARITALEAK